MRDAPMTKKTRPIEATIIATLFGIVGLGCTLFLPLIPELDALLAYREYGFNPYMFFLVGPTLMIAAVGLWLGRVWALPFTVLGMILLSFTKSEVLNYLFLTKNTENIFAALKLDLTNGRMYFNAVLFVLLVFISKNIRIYCSRKVGGENEIPE